MHLSSPLSRAARSASLLALAVSGAVVACDADPTTQPLGSMDITVSTPATTFTTADGWAIKVERFLVNVSAVTVAGSDQVVAASSTPQIIDQGAPGTKSLLSASVRTARPWQEVSFEIGPAATGNVIEIPPVTVADKDAMANAGASIILEGSASKAGGIKTFHWGFTTDTLFKDCTGEVNGQVFRGLSVPQDGNDTADIVLDPSAFFRDALDRSKAVLRFDPFAAADTNSDGTITAEELTAVTLADASALGGGFVAEGPDSPADLGTWVDAQSRRIVASFRAKGSCTPEVVAPEEPVGAPPAEP